MPRIELNYNQGDFPKRIREKGLYGIYVLSDKQLSRKKTPEEIEVSEAVITREFSKMEKIFCSNRPLESLSHQGIVFECSLDMLNNSLVQLNAVNPECRYEAILWKCMHTCQEGGDIIIQWFIYSKTKDL